MVSLIFSLKFPLQYPHIQLPSVFTLLNCTHTELGFICYTNSGVIGKSC